MKWAVSIFFLILIIVGVYFLGKKEKNKEQEGEEKFPYKLHPRFFTKSEYVFYKELKKQVGDKYDIFSKVRLADFIDVDIDKYKNRSEWQTYWNKIKSKHVDFLLCDPETLEPKIAIELNGKSHQSQKMIERDDFIKKVYSKLNLPLHNITVGADFSYIMRRF